MSLARTLRKKIIFVAGDIRRERCPFGFAWGKYERLIDYDEMAAAVERSYPGYVGLHRNRGDLSNMAISGFMKHAWLVGSNSREIIEAVSEGVLTRHPYHALSTDYAVILKPLVTADARFEAVNRAHKLAQIKCPYDDKFTFDLEVEESLFQDKETALSNMKRYGLGVSCTEMVSLAYVGHRRELGLYRVRHRGRLVILPDNFMTTHFEVCWASKSTTPDTALELGLSEEGCSMLREYWEKRR